MGVVSLRFDRITAEARRLPAELRAQLAVQLVESLANTDAGELQEIWAEQATRRLGEIRSGKEEPTSGRHVLAEVHGAVGGNQFRFEPQIGHR